MNITRLVRKTLVAKAFWDQAVFKASKDRQFVFFVITY